MICSHEEDRGSQRAMPVCARHASTPHPLCHAARGVRAARNRGAPPAVSGYAGRRHAARAARAGKGARAHSAKMQNASARRTCAQQRSKMRPLAREPNIKYHNNNACQPVQQQRAYAWYILCRPLSSAIDERRYVTCRCRVITPAAKDIKEIRAHHDSGTGIDISPPRLWRAMEWR